MTEVEGQDQAALDEVLAWNGSVHVFPRETVSKRPNNLKYLWIFPAAVITITAYMTAFYVFMKDTSGPLKPVIRRLERLVKRTVRPVSQRAIHSKLPVRILVFLDGEADYVVQFLDGVLPPTLKELGYKASDVTRSIVAEVQRDGIYVTGKRYFDKYEPVVESGGIQAYQKALTFPLVPQAVACTRYVAVKVNRIIVSLKESGLPLLSFVPLLPVTYFDKIARSE